MEEMRISEATSAMRAAHRHLESLYKDKLRDVTVNKAWYRTGTSMDVWEVEGEVVYKRGRLRKNKRHFKYQINPNSGDVIGFEQ